MLFDDTHIHSAHNQTKLDRIVLFIDIVRPLPWPVGVLNKAIFSLLSKSIFITDVLENYKKFGNKESERIKIDFN